MRNTCKIACILLLNILVFQATGQNIPTKPNPPRLVNDYTHTLTEDQRQALERKLVAIDDSTSTQLAVVIISSLEGQDIGDYTVELGRAWGIGGKEFNNGIVLLIAIKDRKLHIATGYGLEGALTDITSKHIIDDIISPSFKIGDFYRGIDEGTDAIIKAVKGEYHAPRKASGRPKGILKFITIFIIILIYLISKGSSGKGGSFMSRRGTRGLAGPLFWGSILGGGGHGGGGGFGGGSSGGFGGFGGGSFGGGGASGSW